MFTSIVVGVDGSPPSTAAAQTAIALAARFRSRVHLVSVIEEVPRYVAVREEATREAEEAKAYFGACHQQLARDAMRSGMPVNTRILMGHEVQQLLAYVASAQADLLVIGHAGHSGVWGTALGSTATQLLRRATSSVLIVRAEGQAAHLARVVLALDGSPLGWEAFHVALRLVQDTGQQLHVVSALERSSAAGRPSRTARPGVAPPQQQASVTGPLADDSGTVQRFLVHVQARATSRAAASGVPVEVKMRSGPASDALVRAARELSADVLVVGATGHERPWSSTTGATAMKVAEEAPCAVLVVRPQTGTARRTTGEAMQPVSLTVSPATPVADVLALLLDRGMRLVPVVHSDGKLAGILTLGSLLRSIDPAFAAHLSMLHTSADMREHLERHMGGRTAGDTMISHPFTVRVDAPLSAAGRYLTIHHITRAPVIDDAQHLIGIISERDVIENLIAIQHESPTPEMFPTAQTNNPEITAGGGMVTAGSLADRVIPAVTVTASVDEVVRALQVYERGIVIVMNTYGNLAGIIDEPALVQRALPAESNRWTVGIFRLLPRATLQLNQAYGEEPVTAESLMRSPDAVLDADLPLIEALAKLMGSGGMSIGVVVEHDRPIGILTRHAALRALVRG